MLEEKLAGLKPMTEGVSPVTVEERQSRIEKARAPMAENSVADVLEANVKRRTTEQAGVGQIRRRGGLDYGDRF